MGFSSPVNSIQLMIEDMCGERLRVSGTIWKLCRVQLATSLVGTAAVFRDFLRVFASQFLGVAGSMILT